MKSLAHPRRRPATQVVAGWRVALFAHTIGETISHYKILEPPREGVMGLCENSHALKLSREVALWNEMGLGVGSGRELL